MKDNRRSALTPLGTPTVEPAGGTRTCLRIMTDLLGQLPVLPGNPAINAWAIAGYPDG